MLPVIYCTQKKENHSSRLSLSSRYISAWRALAKYVLWNFLVALFFKYKPVELSLIIYYFSPYIKELETRCMTIHAKMGLPSPGCDTFPPSHAAHRPGAAGTCVCKLPTFFLLG